MSYDSSSDSDSGDLDRKYREISTFTTSSSSSSRTQSQDQSPLLLSRLPTGAIPLKANPPDCGSCQARASKRRSSRREEPRRRRFEDDIRGSIPARENFRIQLESAYDVFTPYSTNAPRIRFTFVRTPEDVIFMQWEEFSFTVGASGLPGVNLNHEYDALPPTPITLECPIIYRGIRRQTTISIDPRSGQPFRFNFFHDGSADQVMEKDRVTVPGSCISWITERK